MYSKAGHYVVFHPNRIAVSNVEDRQSAIGEIDGLVKLPADFRAGFRRLACTARSDGRAIDG